MKLRYVIVFSIFVVSLFSGCLGGSDNTENSKKRNEILMIALTVPLEKNNTLSKINYSEVKTKIEELGYTIENTSHNNESSYWVREYTNISKVLVFSYTINETVMSVYWNYAGVTEYFDVDEEKKQNQEMIVKITDVFNTTLDWSIAKWTISYAD